MRTFIAAGFVPRLLTLILGAALFSNLGLYSAPAVAASASHVGAKKTPPRPGWSTIDVEGEDVDIYRDAFGVPHIFADTDEALFVGFGYVTAQDRLYQVELNRRAGRGTLAEIMGSASVNADSLMRINGYTEAELEAQLALLSHADRVLWDAFVRGLNRYIKEVIEPDPANKLPYEFQVQNLGTPTPFTATDILALSIRLLRLFGEPGGREVANKQIFDALLTKYGNAATALAVFNDVRWTNDPKAPTSIPAKGAFGPRQTKHKQYEMPALDDDIVPYSEELDRAKKHWEEIGAATRLGSFGFVVSAAKSAEGYPLLLAGPQAGFAAPEIFFEVQLNSKRAPARSREGRGDRDERLDDDRHHHRAAHRDHHGFNVVGAAIPGLPFIAIGRNEELAWTLMSAPASDLVDTFVETRCIVGGAQGYIFNGVCTPYAVRSEVINVKGAAPVTVEILRSIHGPVANTTPTVRMTLQRSFWGKEIIQAESLLGFNRAETLVEFGTAVSRANMGFNVIYADQKGNIAYALLGCNPLRAEGTDQRLPMPGDGSAEWVGGCRPMPTSLNPVQGWLGNWNNKPTADYEGGDQTPLGEMMNAEELFAQIMSRETISRTDIGEIVNTISKVGNLGREANFLLPYLLSALDAFPSTHPLAASARAVLESWDGYAFTDAISSTTQQAGDVIFSTWLARMIQNTFADDLGGAATNATSNMLLHALDHALAGGSSVPPSRDYFNGAKPNQVMSTAFTQIVAQLAASKGNTPATWTNPRATIVFRHPIIGPVATINRGNRYTWSQIVQFKKTGPVGESIVTLGQSGFIKGNADGTFTLDPHFLDQLPLFTNFEYKPLPLYKNTKLKE